MDRRRKIQNIMIAAALLGIALAVAVAMSVNGLPGATENPNEADNKASDWVSATGSAIGAIGTAGALWLGAVTFRRQVRDQHRVQAAAITVSISQDPDQGKGAIVEVRNDSPFPIYTVILVASKPDKTVLRQEMQAAIPPRDNFPMKTLMMNNMSAYADFKDSSGTKWRRWFNGDLEER
ncbi:hypothetical protein NFC73_11550 [Pseudarthrobacter sp. RMG13]|uniref:Uncharacterized protein n=1 Tax=Pseudarthrobacter humi TaxID=2952523 RepID=A0ABT1LPH9_9MICC|nr:hypothetical protein [Pseudarthrobacter humi]MCP9000357.1 hypothetical protein [Pseudarthrobacter humi]